MKKVVVISGGMGGIGQAVAKLFASKGYEVVALSRSDMDVTDPKQVEKVLSLPHIDVAIHAAVSPIERKNLLDMNAQEFKGQFEASLFGGFNFLKTAAGKMRDGQGGTLIGITSSAVEEEKTSARMGAYTVAKIALQGLLRELHRELGKSGVRVFAVAPDLLKTKLTSDLPDKFFEFAEAASGKPVATLEEVAHAIYTLCESRASGGQIVAIPAGHTRPL